jgi:hypothetical protein
VPIRHDICDGGGDVLVLVRLELETRADVRLGVGGAVGTRFVSSTDDDELGGREVAPSPPFLQPVILLERLRLGTSGGPGAILSKREFDRPQPGRGCGVGLLPLSRAGVMAHGGATNAGLSRLDHGPLCFPIPESGESRIEDEMVGRVGLLMER